MYVNVYLDNELRQYVRVPGIPVTGGLWYFDSDEAYHEPAWGKITEVRWVTLKEPRSSEWSVRIAVICESTEDPTGE